MFVIQSKVVTTLLIDKAAVAYNMDLGLRRRGMSKRVKEREFRRRINYMEHL